MKQLTLVTLFLLSAGGALAQAPAKEKCTTAVDQALKPAYDAYKAEQTVKQGTPSGFRATGVDHAEGVQAAVMETYRVSRQVRECDTKPAKSARASAQ
jgi:hypothetical protein